MKFYVFFVFCFCLDCNFYICTFFFIITCDPLEMHRLGGVGLNRFSRHNNKNTARCMIEMWKCVSIRTLRSAKERRSPLAGEWFQIKLNCFHSNYFQFISVEFTFSLHLKCFQSVACKVAVVLHSKQHWLHAYNYIYFFLNPKLEICNPDDPKHDIHIFCFILFSFISYFCAYDLWSKALFQNCHHLQVGKD